MNLNRVSSLSSDQVGDLVSLYQNEWWSTERRREDVIRMLEETDEVIAFTDADERVVAFARVLTDYVYKAVLFDVIVDERLRGRALGEKLMEAVVTHPKLRGVEHLDLHCLREMQRFYEKHGFETQNDLHLMRRETRTKNRK